MDNQQIQFLQEFFATIIPNADKINLTDAFKAYVQDKESAGSDDDGSNSVMEEAFDHVEQIHQYLRLKINELKLTYCTCESCKEKQKQDPDKYASTNTLISNSIADLINRYLIYCCESPILMAYYHLPLERAYTNKTDLPDSIVSLAKRLYGAFTIEGSNAQESNPTRIYSINKAYAKYVAEIDDPKIIAATMAQDILLCLWIQLYMENTETPKTKDVEMILGKFRDLDVYIQKPKYYVTTLQNLFGGN